jgi:hypothetical protein
MKSKIKDVSALINALGGTKVVAEWAEVDMSAVSHWRRANRIPPQWHYRLFREATDRKLSVDFAAVFGESERIDGDPDRPLARSAA